MRVMEKNQKVDKMNYSLFFILLNLKVKTIWGDGSMKYFQVQLKLEDRGSNELFAACPIDQYPGPAVEAVTDSSR